MRFASRREGLEDVGGRGKRVNGARYTVRSKDRSIGLRATQRTGEHPTQRFGEGAGIPQQNCPARLRSDGAEQSTETVIPTKPMWVDPEPIEKPLCTRLRPDAQGLPPFSRAGTLASCLMGFELTSGFGLCASIALELQRQQHAHQETCESTVRSSSRARPLLPEIASPPVSHTASATWRSWRCYASESERRSLPSLWSITVHRPNRDPSHQRRPRSVSRAQDVPQSAIDDRSTAYAVATNDTLSPCLTSIRTIQETTS